MSPTRTVYEQIGGVSGQSFCLEASGVWGAYRVALRMLYCPNGQGRRLQGGRITVADLFWHELNTNDVRIKTVMPD